LVSICVQICMRMPARNTFFSVDEILLVQVLLKGERRGETQRSLVLRGDSRRLMEDGGWRVDLKMERYTSRTVEGRGTLGPHELWVFRLLTNSEQVELK
jgi:hypothetical protein